MMVNILDLYKSLENDFGIGSINVTCYLKQKTPYKKYQKYE